VVGVWVVEDGESGLHAEGSRAAEAEGKDSHGDVAGAVAAVDMQVGVQHEGPVGEAGEVGWGGHCGGWGWEGGSGVCWGKWKGVIRLYGVGDRNTVFAREYGEELGAACLDFDDRP